MSMDLSVDVTIKPIEDTDIEAVYRITEELGLSSWSRSDLRDELQNADSRLLIATVDATPVGFIVGRQVPGTHVGSFDAEIYNIGVVFRFHQKGIGSSLLEHFLIWAKTRRISNVWLEVRASNISAYRFYEARGFAEVTRRKDYYRGPTDDAIVMRTAVS